MDDLSGLDVDGSGWLDRSALRDVLQPLLSELGRTYVPVMLANARALNAGEEQVETTVEGARWVQQAFPYQGRCVAALRTEYARLDEQDRKAVDAILAGTGCAALFA
jgi:hypothetical protein